MLSSVMLSSVMLSSVMLSVVMLSVVMLSVAMLSVAMLSVAMLSVVMLSVLVHRCQFTTKTFVSLNKNVLNSTERLKVEKMFKMTLLLSSNICSVYLFRAAPYFELHRDDLFNWTTNMIISRLFVATCVFVRLHCGR